MQSPLPPPSLGELLKELRGDRSLRAIADLSDGRISHSQLKNLENSDSAPRPETLMVLSEVYNYPYENLLIAAGYLPAKAMVSTTTAPDPLLRQILVKLTSMERSIEELKKITQAGAQLAERIDATETDIKLLKKVVTKE